jgi:single-stranded-DNA-specific exonuclease
MASFVNAIAFRVAGAPLGQALLENRGRAVHAAGFLAVDRWQGEERVQMRLADIAISKGVNS